jgi:hypothetical protein
MLSVLYRARLNISPFFVVYFKLYYSLAYSAVSGLFVGAIRNKIN